MELAQPLWLLLLPLPLVWAWLAARAGAQAGRADHLLRHPDLLLAGSAAPPADRLPLALQTLALLLLVLALSQPRQVGDWIVPPPEGRDIALVLDTSQTMSIDDFELAGRKVTRLAVLKDVFGRFIAARASDRIGLLAFGSQAVTLTPPSFDHASLKAQLERLQVGVAGDDTALGDALGLALRQIRQGRLRPAIILVSDGGDSNAGDMTPAEAVAAARRLGTAIHTVQIGGDLFAQGRAAVAVADPQPGLADIARLTGGRFWQIHSSADARSVIDAIDALEKTLPAPARHREVREWYLLPLLLGAASLLLARVLAIRRRGL
jgi:Ca-activated chloride channel family protein